MKKYLSSYPELVKEWHPIKNGDLTPQDVTHGSSKKIWWLCSKGHSFDAVINDRINKKTKCPYCSGRRVSHENNLSSKFPEIAKEWHPSKNGNLNPENVTHGSSKKVWWLCSKGHSFARTINDRTSRIQSICPYCSGSRVSSENNLNVLFPNVSKEWHPTKNLDLVPSNFTYGSKTKVWWLCPLGHSYISRINDRTGKNNSGCSYCSGKKPSAENNLEILYPSIVKEWHPIRNGDLTPKDFTNGSDQKVWWLCSEGHSYETSIKNKTRASSLCPFCAGKKASKDNNLQRLFPEIAKEWHPSKNGNLSPKDFTKGSGEKVWWLCPKGHSYQAIITSRTKKENTGCPSCSNQSSEPEIRIFTEFKYFFPDVKNRHKVENVEIDIFIPSINLGVEFDGSYWHKNKILKDKKKNTFLSNKKITLIRARQFPLKKLSKNDVVVSSKSIKKEDIDAVLSIIIPFVQIALKNKIKAYFKKSSFVNNDLYNKYRSFFPSPFPEKSLLTSHPKIAKQWDYEKNYPLRPENFSYGSVHQAWWVCSNGHSFKSIIYNRIRTKLVCPYCSGKKTLNYDLFK